MSLASQTPWKPRITVMFTCLWHHDPAPTGKLLVYDQFLLQEERVNPGGSTSYLWGEDSTWQNLEKCWGCGYNRTGLAMQGGKARPLLLYGLGSCQADIHHVLSHIGPELVCIIPPLSLATISAHPLPIQLSHLHSNREPRHT